MPIRFRYFADRDLLIHIGEGSVTIEEIETLRRERKQQGVPDAVPNILTDMRHARFAFDLTELQANEEGKPAETYAGTRHAEIVTDPRQTAVLLLWRTWLPESVKVEVFSTPAAAYRWLGVAEQAGDLDPLPAD